MATHLRAIDKEFEEADDTGVLVLSGRNLRTFPTVPGELLDFADVFEADFSKNRFDHLPSEIIQFKALTKLNCYHNSLRSIHEEVCMLTNLKHINLSRNYIQRIPSELCKMNLLSLNLSNNRLVSLPLELGKLSSLQFLSVSCNLLQELPASFCELTSLQRVEVHRNELKDLPEGLSDLKELEYLDVSSNQLSRLHVELKDLTLRTFIVSDNPLESPPMQICCRGLGHIIKYLEYVAKRGSDPLLLSMNHRDESLRRRKERVNKRNSSGSRSSTLSTASSMHNGKENDSFYDEMASFVNQAFGNGKGDGDITPTNTLHWSVRQYATSTPERAVSDQSKEYREAAHRLYMEQERQKLKTQRSSSPPPSSSKDQSSEGSTQFNTLPKRKSTENMFAIGLESPKAVGGRSLPGERHPRSGSWNTHKRISSPVLPNKYHTPDRQKSEEGKESPGRRPKPNAQSRSTTDLHTVTTEYTQTSPERKKKKPPPLDSPKKGRVADGGGGGDSDREGSITPTNETPPSEEFLEESTTPKDKKNFHSMDDLLEAADQEKVQSPVKKSTHASAENLTTAKTKAPPPAPLKRPPKTAPKGPAQSSPKGSPRTPRTEEASQAQSKSGVPGIKIRELEGSPTSMKRRPPSSPESDGQTSPSSPSDSTWPRRISPRRKNEKEVFKFLKESDPNYTIRRQQLQMNLILEKNQHVKKGIETLMGVQLPNDIGEWVCDGVILCEVINKLHPGLITRNISRPTPGVPISRLKQTVNVSAFIEACQKLNIPQELLCSAGDIIEMRDPVRVISCLQRVLETKPGNLV